MLTRLWKSANMLWRVLISGLLVALCAVCLQIAKPHLMAAASPARTARTVKQTVAQPAATARLAAAYEKLPLRFEPNRGQTDLQVKFLSRGSGYALFLTPGGAVLELQGHGTGSAAKQGSSSGNLQQPSRRPDALLGRSDPHETGKTQSLAKFLQAFQSPRSSVDGSMSLFPGLAAAGLPGMLSARQNSGQALESSVPDVVQTKLDGANPAARISGGKELPGRVNYLIGNNPQNWRTNIPTYASVQYTDVYPGISLIYHGNQGRLEYDFVVEPGANPNAIKFDLTAGNRSSGSEGPVRIASNGDLVIETSAGVVRFCKPVIYQPAAVLSQRPKGSASQVSSRNSVGGNRSGSQALAAKRRVEGSFVINQVRKPGSGHSVFEVGFKLASYDHTLPLVIDPTLAYSTYLGGTMPDVGIRIATDSSGNAYIVGATMSATFPATTGAFQGTLAGANTCEMGGIFLGGHSLAFPCSDAFVAKIKADGSGLVYATYMGGSLSDVGTAIAVDSSGDAYIAGSTKSLDFPTTPGAFESKPATGDQGGDAFVAKLNPSGSSLVYSTLIGGSSKDFATGLAIDASGDAYVTGPTNSTDFPTTTGAFETTIPGGSSPCAVNISTAGFGNLACWHGFVTEINPSGSGLVYSTYLGGSSNDAALAIAVDSSGYAYVTGATLSTDFPAVGAYQGTAGGGTCLPALTLNNLSVSRPCSDAFVAKLKPDGSGLVYSTYLGGSSDDAGFGIAVDSAGDAYVTGITNSSNFPTTSGSLQPAFGGGSCLMGYTEPCPDAFVTKLSATGKTLVYSSYLGGNSYDLGAGIAVDGLGDAFVVGATSSSNFPTVNPIQSSTTGTCTGRDYNTSSSTFSFNCPSAFITEINPSGSAASFSTFLGGENYDIGMGIALDTVGDIYATGFTMSTAFHTSNALQATAGGLGDAFAAKISGFVTLPASASLSPGTLSFGSVVVDSSSATQDVTLSNSGGSALTVTSIAITGTNSGDFSETNTCGSSVAASGSCTITVMFKPTAAGARSGTLTVTDSAGGSPQTTALSGTGQSFSFTVQTSSQTVTAGGTASFNLQLAPQSGFNQTVNLACSGAPSNSTCTVTPSSVTLDGTNSASVTVKVSTTAGSLVGPGNPGAFTPPGGSLPLAAWLALFGLLALLVLAKLSPKGGRVRRLAPFATLALLVTLWAACGGGGSSTSATSNATPAGTYTLTVTGTSGGLSQSTKVTLVVQ